MPQFRVFTLLNREIFRINTGPRLRKYIILSQFFEFLEFGEIVLNHTIVYRENYGAIALCGYHSVSYSE